MIVFLFKGGNQKLIKSSTVIIYLSTCPRKNDFDKLVKYLAVFDVRA